MEVSQKQSYIFSSNKLKNNVENSDIITWVGSSKYYSIKAKDCYTEEKNYIYSGGGHTILEFSDKEEAAFFVKKITYEIYKEFSDIEVFSKTIECDDQMNLGECINKLTKELERKKAERKSTFHQGSFGIEKSDVNTGKPIQISDTKFRTQDIQLENEKNLDLYIEKLGYKNPIKFSDLGGTKNISNFIAVVHIDGNAMGKRLAAMNETLLDKSWKDYKEQIRNFSESVDHDFKEAYKDMIDTVNNAKIYGCLSMKDNYFPIRRIITAGDDICFVSEGRIGIESAVAFIQALKKKNNKIDGKSYAACAGVAIVHQKYPFYKAYKIAEMLCSNAKKKGATIDHMEGTTSLIDWHIEFGEMKDSLEEIRKKYIDKEGNVIYQRPYVIDDNQDKVNGYQAFKKYLLKIQGKDEIARGKYKNLRNKIKASRDETDLYMKINKMEEDNSEMKFDAIELIDTFIGF